MGNRPHEDGYHGFIEYTQCVFAELDAGKIYADAYNIHWDSFTCCR